jgi:multiple sugar transport system substrate-binding protein
MGENIDAYRSGQVAMQMNLRLSGLVLKADENVGGGNSWLFPDPAGPAGRLHNLVGKASRSCYSEKQDAALELFQWFAQPSSAALVGSLDLHCVRGEP